MAKCILLIDLDGVVCDWTKRLREDFENKFPERKLRPLEELTSFYVEDVHPEEWRADIRAVSQTKGFYTNIEPIAGAIEALKDLEQNCLDFIDPFFCSSPDIHYEDQQCFSEKAKWIEDHLGEFWVDRLILTKHKVAVRGHMLIDDKPEITGVMDPIWGQILYDQPWNKHVDSPARFDWSMWKFLRDEVIRPSFGGKNGGVIYQKTPSIILP